jgi:excisionase family DNA binding protein
MRTYSISEAARLLRIHRRTLHRWIRDKRVPQPSVQVISGVRLRFWTEEDMAVLKRHKAEAYWGKGKRRPKQTKKA